MIYDISNKTFIASKSLYIRFYKIDGFIRIYDGTRYYTLFGSEKYDAIYDRIRYLISLKSRIAYIFSHYFAKNKVDSSDSLPIEKRLSLHNVIILIKSVFNKDKIEIWRDTNSKRKVLCCKKTINIWNDKVDNRVISELSETKTNSKYLIGIKCDKVIRPLVLIMSKISGYVKTFKFKDGDKDKSDRLLSFFIDDEKLLQKYEAIWTKIGDLNNIKLNVLPVYDISIYIKTRIRTYDDKVYTNFCGLNVPENDIELESFAVTSIDFLLVYENKYYRQAYLDNCVYKNVSEQMTDYLDENIFED